MRKKITSVALAILFSLSMAGVSMAGKCKGSVESVDKEKGYRGLLTYSNPREK
jgi:hypothetical protein